MSTRQELLELIEAYADAKVSANAKLQQLAAVALGDWIKAHDIVSPVDVPQEVLDQVKAAQ